MSAVDGLSDVSVNYFRWELYIVVIIVLLACVSLLYATYKYNSDPMDEVSALVVQQSCTSGCRSSSCATRVAYIYKRQKYVLFTNILMEMFLTIRRPYCLLYCYW
jgi:hypothetical protein